MKSNMDLRFYARGHGVALWQIAQRMGIHVQTLIQHLRIPFDDADAENFKQIVDAISEEGR